MIFNMELQSNELEEVKRDAKVSAQTLGYRCKNLLKNTAVSTTNNGITFNVQEDKSISVSGSITSSLASLVLCDNLEKYLMEGETYKVSGSSSNVNSGIKLRILGSGDAIVESTNGEEVIFTYNGQKNIRAELIIRQFSGFLLFKKFYPMIRNAVDTDNTYEPYRESVNDRLGGCHFKYENGKFYIGHEEVETEV